MDPEVARQPKCHNLLGHPIASWDTHPFCRMCLHKTGLFCTRLLPCEICESWSHQQWKVWEASELWSAQKRLKWAEATARRAAKRDSTLETIKYCALVYDHDDGKRAFTLGPVRRLSLFFGLQGHAVCTGTYGKNFRLRSNLMLLSFKT